MFSGITSRNTIFVVFFKTLLVIVGWCLTSGLQAQNLACVEKDKCFEFSYKGYVLNTDATVTLTFGIKVDCEYDLSHAAFELPRGAIAISATNADTSFHYALANPTNNPFYSIKFNGLALNNYKKGVSDEFSYTITAAEFNSQSKIQVEAKAGLYVGRVVFNPQGCCTSTTTINGPAFFCQNNIQTFSVQAVSGVKSYVWTLPSGWSIISGDSTHEITVKTNNKQGTISVQQGISICGSKPVYMLPNVVQAPPISITGTAIVCKGSTNEYEVPAVSGALYYRWLVPPGWQITSSPVYNGYGSKITVIAGDSSGIVSAAAANICNLSTDINMSVTVDPKAIIYRVEGDSLPCYGSIHTYKAITNNSATAFNWTVPNNIMLLSGQGSNTITVKVNDKNSSPAIQVEAKSRYSCNSTSKTITLDVKTAPLITSEPQPTVVYAGNQTTFSVKASGSDLTYKWQVYDKTNWQDVPGSAIYSGEKTENLQITGVPGSLDGYKYRCLVSGYCAPEDVSEEVYLNVVQPGSLVNIRAFLDGPYSTATGFMTTLLNTNNYIPGLQPYSAAPWNYPGTECVPAGFFAANPDIVDWVLIELRTSIAPNTIVARKACFIKKDGLLTDLLGQNLPAFPTVSPGNYYVVISHRSHLEIMSKTPVSINLTYSALHDFTLSYDKAYGVSPMKKRTNNKWVMYSGDANSSGTITTIDWNVYWNSENGKSGYLRSDFDLDGTVTQSDLDNQWRPNNGKASQVPR